MNGNGNGGRGWGSLSLLSIDVRKMICYIYISINCRVKYMVGAYCRQYRIDNNITLSNVSDDENIKTLSAFEMGRSSNIKHLISYIKLSIKLNDVDNFLSGLVHEIEGK